MYLFKIFKSLFFYVWQKRDFFDIFCETIYEDNITWTIPNLNFSFVDKQIPLFGLESITVC